MLLVLVLLMKHMLVLVKCMLLHVLLVLHMLHVLHLLLMRIRMILLHAVAHAWVLVSVHVIVAAVTAAVVDMCHSTSIHLKLMFGDGLKGARLLASMSVCVAGVYA